MATNPPPKNFGTKNFNPLPEWEMPHEPENEGSDYAASFPARKPKIQNAAQKMLALLDRDPPPTYSEVADAIDRIHRENDKR